MAKLLITGDDGSQRTVELSERDLRIGRALENDLVLPDANKGVSRMHAELRFENGRYVIIDLNSQNGTWVDGQRVQRAEVPPNAEISVGPYRLRLQGVVADTQVGGAAAVPAPAAIPTMVGPGQRQAAPQPPRAAPAQKRPSRPPIKGQEPPKPGAIAALARMPKPMIFGGFFVIVLLVVVAGQLFAPANPSTRDTGPTPGDVKPVGESNEQVIARHLTEGKALVDKGDYEGAIKDHFDRILLIDPTHAEATDLKAKTEEKLQQQKAAAAAAAAAASTPPADAGTAPATTVPPPVGSTTPNIAQPASGSATTIPPPATSSSSASTVPPATSSTVPPPTPPKTTPPPVANTTAVTPAPPKVARGPVAPPSGGTAARGAAPKAEAPVTRRPGESMQAYRQRSTALMTKYGSSKAALDRNDFAAAAAGFDSILKDEPGYLDAPQLLVRAREGLRGSARDALDAGTRLDAAGDWPGALQKYDLARQIDPGLAGVDDAVRRVREKMRVAGNDAFKRARQYDALGRSADALKDYEKAAQYLPADDPNRKLARERADQLKAGIK